MNFENLKMTALINAYSALRIPLLSFITPKIVTLDDHQSIVRVRLDFRTRNHLGVMYFGALNIGAELSVALKAIQAIQKSDEKINFIFKDYQVDFLKRADGHVHFICNQVEEIGKMLEEAAQTSERLSRTFEGHAIVPARSDEPIMKYRLTLSVKKSAKKRTSSSAR